MTQKSYPQYRFRAADDATELLLVRHGASQAFVPGEDFPMLGDQGDPPLAPEGRDQAELVGARLAQEPIDAVYVTKLQRTSETAAPLLSRTDLVPAISSHLHEVHLGEWEGGVGRMRFANREDPVVQEVYRTGTWDAVPGAEKSDVFWGRIRDGIEEILIAHPGENVVAFVHGGVIGAAARMFTEATNRFGPVDNCSITHLFSHEGNVRVKSYNDTAHLGGLFTRT